MADQSSEAISTRQTGIEKDVARNESRIVDLEKKKGPDYGQIAGLVLALVGAASTLNWFVISSTGKADREALQLQITALKEELKSAKAASKAHAQEDGHPALAARVEEIAGQVQDIYERKRLLEGEVRGPDGIIAVRERFTALKERFDANQAKFTEFASKDAEHSGKIDRLLGFTGEHSDEIERLFRETRANERQISQVAASSEANFAEVESQMRGENATRNVHESWQDAVIQMVAKASGVEFPDMEIYRSDRIPASATTTPGKIQRNGH